MDQVSVEICGSNFGEARSIIDEWYRRAARVRPFLKWPGGKRLFLTRPEADRIAVPEGKYVEEDLGKSAWIIDRVHRSGLGLVVF
jgi:hypothetical protein